MKLTLLLVFLLLGSALYAQVHSVGLKTGRTYARTERVGYDYYNPLKGKIVDGFYEYQKIYFIMKSGLGYIQRGFTQELIYVDSVGNVLGEGAVEYVKHNYLNVSQLAGAHFGDQFYASILGGFRLGYYLNSRVSSGQFTLNDGGLVSSYNWSFNNLTKMDASAVITCELGYRFYDNWSASFNIEYDYGLKDVRYQNGIGTGTPWKYRNLSFKLGLKYSFPKN